MSHATDGLNALVTGMVEMGCDLDNEDTVRECALHASLWCLFLSV